MTLKEKFHQWLKTEPFSSEDRPTLREAQCEVIAEEFAIEFADWLEKSGYLMCLIRGSKATNKLLEIYKKEKGL
jgi:predicted phosphoadenosine phosphosulfate sulfurtransferase